MTLEHGDTASNTSSQKVDSFSNQSSMVNKIIFVFGSNLAGRHGKGSALYARQEHGAIYGQGVGLQGNAYAIPTKDEQLRILPLESIRPYVEEFVRFAIAHPDMTFNVTAIGCGLARPPNQTREERVRDIRSLFESVQFDPPMEESAPDSGWTGPNVTIHDFPNINLPIEFGGERKFPNDANGEESKN